MKIFRIGKAREKNEDVISISGKIDSTVNDAVHDIFSCHQLTLLSAPSEYMIEAAWGIRQDRQLTDTQRDIHAKVNTVMCTVSDSIGLNRMTNAQKLTVRYLVINLIVAKTMYMLELLRNRIREMEEERNEGKQHTLKTLMDGNVVGHA